MSALIYMNKSNFKYTKGFTLIELLIVISIVGILVALAIFGFGDTFSTARDTQRKSDLKFYQNAIEVYANNNNGYYPRSNASSGQVNASIVLCNYLSLSGCPTDPLKTNIYYYRTVGGSGSGGNPSALEYFLWANLEDTSDGTYWVACSNGKSGTTNTVPSTFCPL